MNWSALLRKTKTVKSAAVLMAACLFACFFWLSAPTFAHAATYSYYTDAYLFWSSGCPHCAKERYFLSKLDAEYDALRIHEYEVSTNFANAELLMRVGRTMTADVSGVPFLVVGGQTFSGFYSEETTGETIKQTIIGCMESGCNDIVGNMLGGSLSPERIAPAPVIPREQPTRDEETTPPAEIETIVDESSEAEAVPPTPSEEPTEEGNGYLAQNVREHPIPETLDVPVLGAIKIKNLSLPVITLIFGALDGFNPCAMWILLFLISLLIHMENRRRMWALGAAFIAASAIAYFLFMAAWLNALLFIGFVFWIRTAVAVLAIAAGGYHIREFFLKPESGCVIVSEERRERMFSRIREVLGRKTFALALLGMVGLAFAVNLIELFCSAGFPVIYTQILTMTNLASWQYYGYLLLYVFIFMLDDLLVFIIAMTTLRMVGVTTKYTRMTRLIGGLLMIAIGLLLFIKPEWLMFG